MSADNGTKTTMVFDGKQANYGKYRLKLRGEFCARGIQVALGLKFKDVLPESEDAISQTAKQKEVVKSNGGAGQRSPPVDVGERLTSNSNSRSNSKGTSMEPRVRW